MPEEIFFFVSRFFDRPDKFEWMPRPAGRSIRIVSDPGNNPGPGLSATTVMLASLLLLTPVCQPGIRPDAVVIIHSGAAAMLLRGGEELPARVGVVLRPDDVIQSRSSNVDLQNRHGTVIRVREFTSMRLISLQTNPAHGTRLRITHGELLVRTPGSGADSNFVVFAPTAKATRAAANTTYTIEVAGGRRPRVKVLQGRVHFTPRIDGGTKETPTARSELVRVLGDTRAEPGTGQIAFLKPQLDLRLRGINASLAAGQDATSAMNAAAVAVRSELYRVSDTEKPPVRVLNEGIGARDAADRLLIPRIPGHVLERALSLRDPEVQVAVIQRAYQKEVNAAANRVQRALATAGLDTRADIEGRYGSFDRIAFADGATVTGAVIGRIGEVLLIHTTGGVIRRDISELDFIDTRAN